MATAFWWLLASQEAGASEQSDLEKAYAAFAAHKYSDAEARLRALLDPKTGTLKQADSVADARMYLGAVLLAEGRDADAGLVLEQLLLENPRYEPDPLRVPLPALDALVDARSRLRDKLAASQSENALKAAATAAKDAAEKQTAARRLALLEKLAAQELVIKRASRWEALVPFGVGQFQNEQPTLGWTLLVGESILVAASAIGSGFSLYNSSLANSAYITGETVTAQDYQTRAKDWALFGNVSAVGFAVAAVAGIAQAEIAFLPEHVVELRQRPLPQASLTPTVGVGCVGLSGHF